MTRFILHPDADQGILVERSAAAMNIINGIDESGLKKFNLCIKIT